MMYDETRLATAPATLAGASETEMAGALSEAQNLGKLIAEARNNLGIFADRMLTGEAPRVDGAETSPDRRSFNAGATGNLRREIELATELANDVLRLTSRLRQIA